MTDWPEQAASYSLGSKTGVDVRQGALEALDLELEQLEKAVSQMADRLAPVISMRSLQEAKMSEDRVEPDSQLRARAMRLAEIRGRLVSLTRDLDL